MVDQTSMHAKHDGYVVLSDELNDSEGIEKTISGISWAEMLIHVESSRRYSTEA